RKAVEQEARQKTEQAAPSAEIAGKPAAEGAAPGKRAKPEPQKPEQHKKSPPTRSRQEPRRREGKLTISQALDNEDGAVRARSIASLRRAREREKRARMGAGDMPTHKVVREVVVPETITKSWSKNEFSILWGWT
ncbi:hypothetical protein LCGC14_3067490, partial [marine sediment metagenome]